MAGIRQQSYEKNHASCLNGNRGPHPLSLHLTHLWHSAYQANPDTVVERVEAALKGIRAYQRHPARRCLPDLPCQYRIGTARLLGGIGDGPNVVLVPSLINPSYILDLDAQNSLLRWLAGQGFRTFLVDWGTPAARAPDLDIAGYITSYLIPLLKNLPQPIHLIGYCLGGLLGLGYAQLSTLKSLTLIATPWDFDAYPEDSHRQLRQLWHQWQPYVATFGLLPMEMLQTAFAGLDPGLSLKKFTHFYQLDPKSAEAEAFVILEDWANQGPPLSKAAAADCFVEFFQQNKTAKLLWTVKDRVINPAQLNLPCLCLTSQTDRLVPSAVCAPLVSLLQTKQHVIVPAGHVGMIAGSKAQSQVWQPIVRFLKQAS